MGIWKLGFKTEKEKVIWEEISASLFEHGIDRGPDQCKSLWASLVTKYESLLQGEKSKKAWPFLAEMEKILSGQSRRVLKYQLTLNGRIHRRSANHYFIGARK